MIIRRQFQFDSAHMLSQYEGKCANLHGHTYTGDIEINAYVNPATGMVLDYNVIKEVVEKYDHRTLFSTAQWRGEAEEELLRWCQQWGMKYKFVENGKCTAENIAMQIAAEVKAKVGDGTVKVWLHETPGSTAIGVA